MLPINWKFLRVGKKIFDHFYATSIFLLKFKLVNRKAPAMDSKNSYFMRGIQRVKKFQFHVPEISSFERQKKDGQLFASGNFNNIEIWFISVFPVSVKIYEGEIIPIKYIHLTIKFRWYKFQPLNFSPHTSNQCCRKKKTPVKKIKMFSLSSSPNHHPHPIIIIFITYTFPLPYSPLNKYITLLKPEFTTPQSSRN